VSEYLAPGNYVESTSALTSIEGVDTNSALMVGVTVKGPDEHVPITSFADFTKTFGEGLAEPAPALRDRWALDLDEGGHWWHFALSVIGFFENGGRRAVIKRVSCDVPEDLTPEDFVKAIQSLNEVTDVGLCLVPGMWSGKVQTAVIQHCEAQRDCFVILDPPNGLDSPEFAVLRIAQLFFCRALLSMARGCRSQWTQDHDCALWPCRWNLRAS